MSYVVRPITVWPGKPASYRGRSPFSATFRATMELLERELRMLGAKNILLQAFVEERDIRNDGLLRSDARPRQPGVILSFDSKHGRLSYPCDRFSDWEGNLRAIALGLEHLRAVNRYGITQAGEQYAGWKALPAPSSGPADSIRDRAGAVEFLTGLLKIRPGDIGVDVALRQAEMATHPDRGGNPDDFKRVQRCRELLRA